MVGCAQSISPATLGGSAIGQEWSQVVVWTYADHAVCRKQFKVLAVSEDLRDLIGCAIHGVPEQSISRTLRRSIGRGLRQRYKGTRHRKFILLRVRGNTAVGIS